MGDKQLGRISIEKMMINTQRDAGVAYYGWIHTVSLPYGRSDFTISHIVLANNLHKGVTTNYFDMR